MTNARRCSRWGKYDTLTRAKEMNTRQRRLLDRVVALYRDAALAPPSRADAARILGVPPQALESMVVMGQQTGDLMVTPCGIVFHAEAVASAQRVLIEALQTQGSLAAGEYRALLGASRKFAVALLELFDEIGLTRRLGDRRVLAESPDDESSADRQCPP